MKGWICEQKGYVMFTVAETVEGAMVLFEDERRSRNLFAECRIPLDPQDVKELTPHTTIVAAGVLFKMLPRDQHIPSPPPAPKKPELQLSPENYRGPLPQS